MGPAVAIALGVGGAALGLSRYRLEFLAVGLTVVLLGLGLAARRVLSCAAPAMRRRHLGQLLIAWLISFALAYGLGAWLVPNVLLSWTGVEATTRRPAPAATKLRRATLAVDGMYCPACVGLVRHVLHVTPGVVRAEVRTGAARIVYDPARVRADQVAAALSVYFPSAVRSEGPYSP